MCTGPNQHLHRAHKGADAGTGKGEGAGEKCLPPKVAFFSSSIGGVFAQRAHSAGTARAQRQLLR